MPAICVLAISRISISCPAIRFIRFARIIRVLSGLVPKTDFADGMGIRWSLMNHPWRIRAICPRSPFSRFLPTVRIDYGWLLLVDCVTLIIAKTAFQHLKMILPHCRFVPLQSRSKGFTWGSTTFCIPIMNGKIVSNRFWFMAGRCAIALRLLPLTRPETYGPGRKPTDWFI